jgi:hypothetical protein
MFVHVFYSIYTYNIEGMNGKGTEKERKRNGKGTEKERKRNGKGTTKERVQKGREDTLANFAKRGGHFG